MPLVDAMRLRVLPGTEYEPILVAPLDPNRNHADTFFGGSAAALAILAGWAAVHLRMRAEGLDLDLVIQRSEVDYVAPIVGELRARAVPPTEEAWRRFRKMIERSGKGRIEIEVVEDCAGEPAVRFRGDFVALPVDGAS
jgi:thioesterase domain-containing protein